MTNLRAQVDEMVAGLPAAFREELDRTFRALTDAGIQTRPPKIGDVAPDFVLPDRAGRPVRLSERLSEGPVVLNFYRGAWCPICQLELQALEAALPQIRAAGATLVSVSPQALQADSPCPAEGHTILADAHNGVGLRYGLVWHLPKAMQDWHRQFGIDLPVIQGEGSWLLPIPASFVIDTDGRIALAFIDIDYRQRLEPDRIVATLQSL